MSRIALYALACLMTLSIVASKKIQLPLQVAHIDSQCQKVPQRFGPACANQELPNGELDCQRVWCMGPKSSIAGFRAMNIGRAADGTHCAENKVCHSGQCIDIPHDLPMPLQYGRARTTWKCYWTNGGKVSSHVSG